MKNDHQMGFQFEESGRGELRGAESTPRPSGGKKASPAPATTIGRPPAETSFGVEPSFDDEDLDLEDVNDTQSDEPQVLSVGELNSHIRQILEGEFPSLWIKGEISNFKKHTSGHMYFSLKDEKAQVSAVMFRGLNSKLKFKPQNGMEVLVRGKVTVYEPRGSYQVFCEGMEPVGAGALQQAFEQLKAKLEREGLFSQSRKRALPSLPKHIGIVTSPTGAALRDILNVLARRYPSAKITISPALVQGETAAPSIVKAIQLINQLSDVDVLIVGRGGGSLEDMWCFNEESVARAIVASKIPVVSAVGHEVDFTIADFVADLRAPTPSAAAEIVAKSAMEVLDKVRGLKERLWVGQKNVFQYARQKVESLTKQLVDPKRRLEDLQIRTDELITRLEQSFYRFIQNRRVHIELTLKKLGSPKDILSQKQYQLETLKRELKQNLLDKIEALRSSLRTEMGRLDALSPLRVVERGYSIVESSGQGSSGENKILTEAKGLQAGDSIEIQFAKGRVRAKIDKVINEESIKGGLSGF